MKTIEERARLNLQYEKDFLGHDLSDDMVCRAYIKGATEQKAIDNVELSKLKSAWENESKINHDTEKHYKQGCHDTIEKACNWLKENIEGGLLVPYSLSDLFGKDSKNPPHFTMGRDGQ